MNTICDRSMQELHDLSKPFKYVISCVIVQKNGAGFHIGHSAYWDISNDNVCQACAAHVNSRPRVQNSRFGIWNVENLTYTLVGEQACGGLARPCAVCGVLLGVQTACKFTLTF